ncbi:MAG: MbnP family protein [Flavobacteriaceae bacterium]
MKKIALLLMMALAIVSCKKNDDDGTTTPQNVTVDFNFTQNWDGAPIANADFDVSQYTTANNEVLSLSKLVYLISDITFKDTNGMEYDAGDYKLVKVREGDLTFTPDIELPQGTYTVSFTFGFDDEDNNLNHPDLNSPSADGSWNVPLMLGGGYHYMRMEGKYINPNVDPMIVNFQYHTIRANKHSYLPPDANSLEFIEDTSFKVNLGQIIIGENTTIEVKMNVAEWFKNPNTWDLTMFYQSLMPNYTAQIMMHENGQNGVFSLGEVTQ